MNERQRSQEVPSLRALSCNNIDTDDDARNIIEYGMMLVTLLASCPDFREVPDGIRLTIWHMIDHAKAIQERQQAAMRGNLLRTNPCSEEQP